MIPVEVATSWSALQELLFGDTWRKDLGRFRSSFAYRGSRYLTTGLARLGGAPPQVETHLLRAFRKYATAPAAGDNTVWSWLALAQHHALPTRLLDWSYSPLVALHFATADRRAMHEDGSVWMVDFRKTNAFLPPRFRTALSEAGSDVFTTDLLARVTPDLAALDALGETVLLFLEPPSLDARIVNPFALFSLLSAPDGDLEPWLDAHDGVARRVVIPADLKWEVRDKLDQANVTERVLFPGLDGLCRWLARYYGAAAGVRANARGATEAIETTEATEERKD